MVLHGISLVYVLDCNHEKAIPPGAPPQQGYSMAPSAPPQYGSPETYLADNVGYGQPAAPNGWVRKASPKISISFTGHHLQDRDWTSKSDPMAVFFLYDVPNRKWFEAGRTEGTVFVFIRALIQ